MGEDVSGEDVKLGVGFLGFFAGFSLGFRFKGYGGMGNAWGVKIFAVCPR